MRALKCFDQNLPENTMKLFEKRFEEQYDAEGDSDAGKLYSIYRSVKLLLDEKSASSQTTESSNTVSANLNSTTNALPADLTISAAVPTDFTEPGENLNPINQASTSSVEIRAKRVQNLLSPIHTVNIQIPDEQASSVSRMTDEAVDIQLSHLDHPLAMTQTSKGNKCLVLYWRILPLKTVLNLMSVMLSFMGTGNTHLLKNIYQ